MVITDLTRYAMKIKMTNGLFVTMLVAIAPIWTKAAKLENLLLRRVEPSSNEDKVSRDLANEDFVVGNDTPPPGYAVWEKKPCVPFSSVSDTQKFHENSDGSCADNECGGCCRSYHWLLCDEGDSFPSVPCICNENTRDPTTFTAVPIVNNLFPTTVQPATVPTPVATPAPTSIDATVQPATVPTPVVTPVPAPTNMPQAGESESSVENNSTVLLLPGPPRGLDCIPATQVTTERNHYRTDEGCREDDWGQCEGSCRVFAWLICEKEEDGPFLSQLAKVCGTGNETIISEETIISRANPDDEPF